MEAAELLEARESVVSLFEKIKSLPVWINKINLEKTKIIFVLIIKMSFIVL